MLCQTWPNVVLKREYDGILWRHKQRISSNNYHHTRLLNTGIWQGGIQSISRPAQHQTSARHFVHAYQPSRTCHFKKSSNNKRL